MRAQSKSRDVANSQLYSGRQRNAQPPQVHTRDSQVQPGEGVHEFCEGSCNTAASINTSLIAERMRKRTAFERELRGRLPVRHGSSDDVQGGLAGDIREVRVCREAGQGRVPGSISTYEVERCLLY